jgi:7-cyano-7-deazaguanine tRNA-ribosyltransferase
LFDSAAYAIFARDDRILSPHGTVRLKGLTEWPIHSAALFGLTPEEVRDMDPEERSVLLAHHNLEITQAELARCREAIRNGSIWQLAERRSHASPQLRDAFTWVLEQLEEIPDGPVGISAIDLMVSTNPVRSGGEKLSDDIGTRPYVLHLHTLLSMRWRLPGSWWDGSDSGPERVVLIEGTTPPWRDSALGAVVSALLEEPRSIILLSTPLGPIPFTLEDVSPWCHLDCPDDVWLNSYEDEEIAEGLAELGLAELPLVRIEQCAMPEGKHVGDVRDWLDRCAVVDKLAVLCGVSPSDGCSLTEGMSSRRSRTDRMVNVLLEDEHILSPRLSDGGISLALGGAQRLNALNPGPPSRFDDPADDGLDHPGMPRVWLLDDAIPFVGRGRNVMQGYVLGADPHLTPGQPCLVVDGNGGLIAHGTAVTTAREMAHLKKGIAVRVRDGALRDD